jgi:hypothetical protein
LRAYDGPAVHEQERPMRTKVVTSLALGVALAWGSPLPALGQATDQAETEVACFIPYGSIFGPETVTRGGEFETGETVLGALLQLVGTPSDPLTERLRLTCRDQVDPPDRPLRETRFDCDIFRGHRNPTNPDLAVFQTTTDTRIQIDGDGAVIMRCTAG